MILEFVKFKLKKDTKKEDFLKETRAIHDLFLKKQDGFISRKTAFSNNEYCFDLVEWEDMEKAKNAIKSFEIFEGGERWMNMIDIESVEMEHLEGVVTYNS